MTPTRFATDIQSVCKLPLHEVLLSLRTISGVSRKIFNIKTCMWRDATLGYGAGVGAAKPGVHLPQCMDPSDHWEIVCDRVENVLYILATRYCSFSRVLATVYYMM